MIGKMYRVFVVRRTSLNLDIDLVAEARTVLGTRGTTDTVHRALEEVVRQAKLRALAAEDFRMSEEELTELRRWRPERWQADQTT